MDNGDPVNRHVYQREQRVVILAALMSLALSHRKRVPFGRAKVNCR